MPTRLRRPDGSYHTITAQPAAVAAVAGATPAGGSGATAGAYADAATRDVHIATLAEVKASLNDLIAKLKTAGIIAT